MIVPTIVREMTNTAADIKAGRQRAASQSSMGNTNSTGTTTSHQWSGNKKMMIAMVAATATSATMPSKTSRRGGGTRTTDASPMINGATAMIPIASDENQCCQLTRTGTSGL